MAKPFKKRNNKEGEVFVEEDSIGLDILDLPDFGSGNARDWITCEECGNGILLETNGKTYYHTLACSFSNGIGYNDERQNTTLPHVGNCNCTTCLGVPKETKKK